MQTITLSSHEASVLSYALDQHIVTLRDLLKAGTTASLSGTFQSYIDDMQALLNRIEEG